MPTLIALGSHDVLDPIFHLREVVLPPVKFPDADEVKGVKEETHLDLEVKGRVSAQRWRQVYFHEPRLELLVNENIEAK